MKVSSRSWTIAVATAVGFAFSQQPALAGFPEEFTGDEEEDHPDPNEEHHEGMVYIGRLDDDGQTRVGFHEPNGIKYIFGTGFDETHKEIEERDLHHDHYGANTLHDLADRAHGLIHEKIPKEKLHRPINPDGPKPFGWVDTHPLDGGVVPPKVVHVDPFFMDETPVTNKQFAKFVRATYYETEAEQFGWSFVLASFLPKALQDKEVDVDPDAEQWVAVDGAYWRNPEGPGSSYKMREHHPVVHVSHRDAAEYCKWVGKRLPGEWEWEAAARAGHYGPKNRTLFSWGDDDNIETASKNANFWQGEFPWDNKALDGWRGTSPVKSYPPNRFGLYDMTGNVWEWMRGGKHKARIVRGGSYVDSLDGSFNHAATLGARATLHATTASGNVGFRCAKVPKRRTEWMWVYEGEENSYEFQMENPDTGTKTSLGHTKSNLGDEPWILEDEFDEFDEGDYWDQEEPMRRGRRKKKVKKERMRYSNEL